MKHSPSTALSSIGRFPDSDRPTLTKAYLQGEIAQAFDNYRAFQFYLDRDILAGLQAGASAEEYTGHFLDIRNRMFDEISSSDAYLRSRLQNDARLATRLVRGIGFLHQAVAAADIPSLAGRRYVLIKELLGQPTICHVSPAETILLHVGPGPDWLEVASIYLGLNICDVLRIDERKGETRHLQTLTAMLVQAARSIETGFDEITQTPELEKQVDELLDGVMRVGSIREHEAPPEELRFEAFSKADRREHLQMLNARVPGDELNFHYDHTVEAIESLEEHARQYKTSNDGDSLAEIVRLLVAAAGHDVHEVRNRSNLALERIFSPKPYDAPPATKFITVKQGDTYTFRFQRSQDEATYALRLYFNQAKGEFPLNEDLVTRDIPLKRAKDGTLQARYTFTEYGEVDFVVFRRGEVGSEWLHDPGCSGRICTLPDVRGDIILEIFADIHGHTRVWWRNANGHPGLVYNESGEIIRLGRFSDITAHLADLKERYYITAIYLLGVQKRGSNKEDWAPEASSPSPFSPMSLTELEPSLGGDAEFHELVEAAHAHDIHVIVDIVPHLNRRSKELPDELAVQCYDSAGNLVERAATDGRFGSWNDGKLLNYRKLAIWRWLADSVETLIERYDIDGIRFDSAHAVPIMMKRNNDLAIYHQAREPEDMVEGRIIVNEREDEHFVTTGYYDSACRDLISVPFHHYLMARVERTLRRTGKDYFVNLAECYWGHERFLARSGIIPYNSALFKICENITHGKTDVRELYHVYDHYFPSALPEGAVMLGILGNHDERRALNTFGHRGLRAAVALTVFMSDIVMDYEGNAEGESWKVYLDNIYVNWNQFESVSHRSLERFYKEWFELHRSTDGRGFIVWANNNQVAAAVRRSGDDFYIGAFNFADSNEAVSIQLDNPRLPIPADEQYRLVDIVYSPITGHYNFYEGRELRHSRINTVVPFTERVKLLKLERLGDRKEHFDALFRDSFARLCDLQDPAHFEDNFAFRELAEHAGSFRKFSIFLRRHIAQDLAHESLEQVHLGLKRTFYHLFRLGKLDLQSCLAYFDKLCAHKDQDFRQIGRGLTFHNEPGPMVFLSAEAEPFSKSGGLANVVYELPRQLARLGEDVHIITPIYRQGSDKAVQMMQDACREHGVRYTNTTVRVMIMDATYEIGIHKARIDGITYLLLDNGELFDGLYWGVTSEEKMRRRLGFARACTETICTLQLRPLFVFTNDAFAGLFNGIVRSDPLYLNNDNFKRTSFLHIIHNGGWQYFDSFHRWEKGVDLFNLFNLPAWRANDFMDPVHGDRLNCMATGIRFADRVFTVSPSYATQIQHACDGLEHLLKDVIGISNGIGDDFYQRVRKRFVRSGFVLQHEADLAQAIKANPVLQEKLAERYPELLDGLAAVRQIEDADRRQIVERLAYKLMLQMDRGLDMDPDKILFVMIHRITEQKGFQLLLEASEGIFTQLGFQAIIGGAAATGDQRGEELAKGLWQLGQTYPRSVHVSFGFQDVAIPFMAGDVVGMPSQSEPGGLVQLEAFACSNLVVARATGGLRDTVFPVKIEDGAVRGNGFLFSDYSAWGFYDAMQRCATFFHEADDATIHQARQNARQSVFHWDRPARRYIEAAYGIKEIIRPLNDTMSDG